MPRPLQGLRVVDFSHALAGPFATNIPAMLGSEVIRIENPKGDLFGNDGPKVDGPPPFLSENADEILGSLGYAEEEIAALHADGVVREIQKPAD